MRIMWNNKIDSYTVSADSADGNYPAENVQDVRLSKVWRSTDASTDREVTVDAGTGATISANCACIAGHNLSSGMTATIQACASSGFTTPSFSTTFTYSTGIMRSYFSSSDSKRFWRFKIDDTGNGDDYIEIGRFYLGDYLTLGSPFQRDFPEDRIDNSRQFISVEGQAYGDEGVVRRSYPLNFPYISQTEKQDIETMYDTIKITKPFFLELDENNSTKIKPAYAVLTEPPGFTHMINLQWVGTMSFEEVR